MVLLLTDVFLLLTQIFLWLLVGLATWFVLLRALPKPFLSLLVLLLILVVLALAFVQGPPAGGDTFGGDTLESLWRVIAFPLTPFGLGFILLLLLLTGAKLKDFAKKLILLTLILLALSSVPIVSYFLVQELEFEAIELVQATPALPAGARRVIVLVGQDATRAFLRPRQEAVPVEPTQPDCPQGCAPTTPPRRIDRPISAETYDVLSRLPIQLTEQGDNIIYAAQLYREETARGSNPLILVSAGSRISRLRRDGERPEDVSEAADIRTFLIDTMNVPAASILLDTNGFSVRRSAENARRILIDEQRLNFGNQIFLVDSAINMNRAYLTFLQEFNDATIVARPTDFYTLPQADRLGRVAQGRDVVQRQLLVSDFLPSVDAFYASSRALEEYLNAFYYFLRGWIRPFR
jgi:uncharacterized SAM-binding protein YcdF (DUF218 family)